MKKISFCSLSFRSTLIRLILVSFWIILPYSIVIPPRSGIFRYNSCLNCPMPVPFGFIPESFRFVPAYSGLFQYIPPHSGSFWYIPVPFLFIPAYSGLFRYIPVQFLFKLSHAGAIRFYSRVIPLCSGIFRFIPVHSTSFRFVLVYSSTILVNSGIFRFIPVYSVPFLCLVMPVSCNVNKTE